MAAANNIRRSEVIADGGGVVVFVPLVHSVAGISGYNDVILSTGDGDGAGCLRIGSAVGFTRASNNDWDAAIDNDGRIAGGGGARSIISNGVANGVGIRSGR